MPLVERLKGLEAPNVPTHQFFGAVLALRDGEITRAQLESAFDISTTGQDKTDLDAIIGKFTGIVARDVSDVGNAGGAGPAIRAHLEALSREIKELKYENTVHGQFLLTHAEKFGGGGAEVTPIREWNRAELLAWIDKALAHT